MLFFFIDVIWHRVVTIAVAIFSFPAQLHQLKSCSALHHG